MNLSETARNGDHLETLKALRQVLSETIESTSSARETATLACQLRQVLHEIDELESGRIQRTDGIAKILKRRADEQTGSVRHDRSDKDGTA